MTRRCLVVLAAVLLFGSAADGRERGKRVSRADRARARKLIKSGDMSYRLLKFEEALADYQEAYRLTGHPAIIFNIAQSYRQLKNHEKARFYYKLFLSDWGKRYPRRPPPAEAEVRDHIERLTARIEEEQRKAREREQAASAPTVPEVQPAKLALDGLRRGATLYIDNKRRRPGAAIELPPGPHDVRVEREGCEPWSATVQLEAGKLHRERVDQRIVDHRTAWLVTSVSLTAVAAGLLGMGAYYNHRYNQYIPETPEADDSRRLSVIGYAAAGGAAALAGVGWTLYLLHRRRVVGLMEAGPAVGAGLAPLRGGVLARGTVRF